MKTQNNKVKTHDPQLFIRLVIFPPDDHFTTVWLYYPYTLLVPSCIFVYNWLKVEIPSSDINQNIFALVFLLIIKQETVNELLNWVQRMRLKVFFPFSRFRCSR